MVGKTISHDKIPAVFEPVSPYLLTRTLFEPARIMHRFSSRSDESADLSALRHAGLRPPQTYCTVR